MKMELPISRIELLSLGDLETIRGLDISLEEILEKTRYF